MGQNTLTIEYSDEVLRRTGLPKDKFASEARLLLAAKLYEMGHLSSGDAAQMAGLERVDFLLNLGRFGIPISNLRESDIADDVDFALNG
ncbi:MAG: UPF0175 family protein [Acidobacteria bacterium]|nr:UPF0175 family protein [Acidobacteriota bacterium]